METQDELIPTQNGRLEYMYSIFHFSLDYMEIYV